MFLRVFKYFKGEVPHRLEAHFGPSLAKASVVPRAYLKPAWGPLLLKQALCRERDSNPHNLSRSRDFKSLVSTIPPSRQPYEIAFA